MAGLQLAYQLVPVHRARPRLAAPPDRPTAAFVVRSARAMEWGEYEAGGGGGDKFVSHPPPSFRRTPESSARRARWTRSDGPIPNGPDGTACGAWVRAVDSGVRRNDTVGGAAVGLPSPVAGR